MRRIVQLSVAFLAGSALIAPAMPANAATTPSDGSVTLSVRGTTSSSGRLTPPKGALVMSMKAVGVNAEVARAHGFTTVKGADGVERAVPTSAAVNPDGTPYRAKNPGRNAIFDNCGMAYLYVHPVGGRVVEIETGFSLNDSAIAYYWRVNRHDIYGSDTNSWAGALGFDSDWVGEWDVRVGGSGRITETATIVTPVSDALLWNGTICVAGPATDTDTVV